MGTCPPHPADKRTVNVSFCQCPMMNCIRALSLNGRLDNQSGGQVHFHNHYLDVFFARWLPTPERTTSDMSAHSLVNSIKPDRGQKYQFHLRPLAFGEIIIFTPTSGSLSKKSSIFCTLLRPKVARPKIPYFCVGPDGNIRAENVGPDGNIRAENGGRAHPCTHGYKI